jgi:hypothetical protein
MSDEENVPSTDEVRDLYVFGTLNKIPGFSDRVPEDEFDRWLAEHDRQVSAAARLDSLLQRYEQPADARHQLDIITGRPLSDDE